MTTISVAETRTVRNALPAPTVEGVWHFELAEPVHRINPSLRRPAAGARPGTEDRTVAADDRDRDAAAISSVVSTTRLATSLARVSPAEWRAYVVLTVCAIVPLILCASVMRELPARLPEAISLLLR